DEHGAFPALEAIARVENKTRWADRRNPEHARAVHAGAEPRLIGNLRSGVVPAGRHERPPVVVTRPEDIDLVAAHRPNLSLPELAGLRMNRQAVAVAVPVGEDLRPRAGPADERIVRRNAPIVTDPKCLAVVGIEALCPHPQAVVFGAVAAQAITVANRDIQR